jgi:hypothetical protein
VKALVYVAAFAPSEGEATGNLGKDYAVPPGIATLQVDAGGYPGCQPTRSPRTLRKT